MEEFKKEHMHMEGGNCPECEKIYGMHGWHGGMHQHCGKFRIIRFLLGILIVLAAFWFGIKVGEIRSIYGGYGYGYGMRMMYPVYDELRGGNTSGSQVVPGPGMMYNWYYGQQSTTTSR